MTVSPAAGDGFLAELRRRAASRPRSIVYPEGTDSRVLDAVAECVREGLVRPVLLGPVGPIADGLAGRGVDPDAAEILSLDDPTATERTLAHVQTRRAHRNDTREALAAMAADPLFRGATLVAEGGVDGMVAGCVRTTADVVRAGLVCIGLAPGMETLSSAFYMVFEPEHPSGPRVLTFTDAGVVPSPSPAQLAEIAAAAVVARGRIVGDEPRVAFLSYSTKGSADGPEVEPVRQAVASFTARMPEVAADGELQGDAALDVAVGARKAPGSPVAGRANILVFPDLASANIAYKLVQYLGGAVALGPIIQGLARPLNDLSRGAAAADIVAVSCITSLQAG